MPSKEKLKRFYKNNNQLLQNEVIKQFLQTKENEQLLEQVLMDPSDENKKILDKQFKEYYLKIKVIKYISSIIYFYTIDFDKRNNKRNRRTLLTLDSAVYKDDTSKNSTNLIDILPSPNCTEADCINSMKTFNELIESVNLYNAYQKLTRKQKEILELIYIHGFYNNEIALIYDETPQNISNIHKRALKKIRDAYDSDRG